MKRLRAGGSPEHAACVFDAKGPDLPRRVVSQYKAQRAPMPDDLARADRTHPRGGAPAGLAGARMVPGVEADDVIGTLARRAAARASR